MGINTSWEYEHKVEYWRRHHRESNTNAFLSMNNCDGETL